MKKHAYLRNLIAFSLLLGVIAGFVGTKVPVGPVQQLFWALSTFFMIIGCSLLGSKLTREDHDIPAAGFIVLGIANAMLYGFIATHDAGTEQFGAGIMIYVPGLLLVSLYDLSPVLLRVLGFIAAAIFAALALIIFMRLGVERARPILDHAGYSFMSVMLLGWAWLVFRKKI